MARTLSSLFASADEGDSSASAALFTALYAKLHRMAKRHVARSHGTSLGTTTLLHEAYLDLSRHEGSIFPDRARFMAYASRVMRGLVIDYARKRRAEKRGGKFHITSIDDVASPEADDRELARISDALDELAAVDPLLAEIVDLKFFGGFSFAEIAAMREVTERTVQRHWAKARILLHRTLRGASFP